jgi:hypothetical protein
VTPMPQAPRSPISPKGSAPGRLGRPLIARLRRVLEGLRDCAALVAARVDHVQSRMLGWSMEPPIRVI